MAGARTGEYLHDKINSHRDVLVEGGPAEAQRRVQGRWITGAVTNTALSNGIRFDRPHQSLTVGRP